VWLQIRAGLGAVGIKPAMPDYEESVEQFIRRNLGDEVFERLIEPFCSGVYAGDPSKLGMKVRFARHYTFNTLRGRHVTGFGWSPGCWCFFQGVG
jgi:oxygen-dependent protoporphyrinogen oxidase